MISVPARISKTVIYLAVVSVVNSAAVQASAKPETSSAEGGVSNVTSDVSSRSMVWRAPARGDDLHLRITTPASGSDLPIILFAHGNGLSSEDYDPLVKFWAGHGFVVVQPTFLDSTTLNLSSDDPRIARIWRFRIEDMKRILDHLDVIESNVPGLKGRLDRSRIAVVGHSYGGMTAAMLLGARVIGPDGSKEDMSDPRIKAGVLLSTAGRGENDLSAFAAARYPFMNPSFSEMIKPALVIAGDQDVSHLTVRGPDWFTDPYILSQGDKCLVTLFGAGHMLGGISGTRVDDMSEKNPEHVDAVRRLSWAYLQSALYPEESTWRRQYSAMTKSLNPLGKVVCK